MTPVYLLVPDEAPLFDVAESAAARGLRLLSNGRRAMLSATPMRGWTEIHVNPIGLRRQVFERRRLSPSRAPRPAQSTPHRKETP
jgi:hypothetical protein